MRDRLVELLCNVKCEGEECFGNCPHRIGQKCNKVQRLEMCSVFAIADHLLAEGVIVPPVKVGQTVYVLRSQTSNGENLYLRKERIDHYRTFQKMSFMCFESGHLSVPDYQWENTIFLTREEAEKALAERNGE